MALDMYHRGVPIGSVIRSAPGVVHCWNALGVALGTSNDIDAAVARLTRREAA